MENPGQFWVEINSVAAGLAHALATPHSVVPALGASGAIAGVIGCYLPAPRQREARRAISTR